MVDVVLRAAKAKRDYGKIRLCFYADDGLLESKVPHELQSDLDLIINLFKRMGLNTIEIKTKFMVVIGTQAQTVRSQEMFNEMMKGDMKDPNWQKQEAACPKCGKMLLNGSMR